MGNWKPFYESIDGFKYEEGYVYKLLVKEENALKPISADASLKNYKLVRVIQKEYNPKLLLNNKWTLAEFKNAPVVGDSVPNIEFNLDLRKMSASDGCNTLVSEIKSVVDGKIYLGNIISTRKTCQEMDLAKEYGQLLNQIDSYKIENQRLILLNRENTEILTFKKND